MVMWWQGSGGNIRSLDHDTLEPWFVDKVVDLQMSELDVFL